MCKDYLSLTFALTFVGKIIFTTFPLPFQLALLKKKNHRAVHLPRPLKAEKAQELRQTSFTFKHRSPPIFKNVKVNCCPISMPQIITSTLLQTPQKPTLFSCFVNSFAIDTRCGNKRSINTSGIKINQLIELIFPVWRQNHHPPSPSPVYMCVVEKAVRNQTFEKQFSR